MAGRVARLGLFRTAAPAILMIVPPNARAVVKKLTAHNPDTAAHTVQIGMADVVVQGTTITIDPATFTPILPPIPVGAGQTLDPFEIDSLPVESSEERQRAIAVSLEADTTVDVWVHVEVELT